MQTQQVSDLGMTLRQLMQDAISSQPSSIVHVDVWNTIPEPFPHRRYVFTFAADPDTGAFKISLDDFFNCQHPSFFADSSFFLPELVDMGRELLTPRPLALDGRNHHMHYTFSSNLGPYTALVVDPDVEDVFLAGIDFKQWKLKEASGLHDQEGSSGRRVSPLPCLYRSPGGVLLYHVPPTLSVNLYQALERTTRTEEQRSRAIVGAFGDQLLGYLHIDPLIVKHRRL